MIKAPTYAEHSFLWIFTGYWSISELILKVIFLTVFIKRICYFLIETKTLIKTLSLGSLRNRLHICIYTAWIGRRDLPLQGLSCCFVKHFDISGSEFVGSCIKLTGRVICRVSRGEGVGVATVGVGIAVASSVVVYVQVVSATKRWSVVGTRVNSVTVMTWHDVHLNRSVAIDVI